MLHTVPGAAATAANPQHLLRQHLSKVPSTSIAKRELQPYHHVEVAAVQHRSSVCASQLYSNQPQARCCTTTAAGAGSSESCSTSYGNSGSVEQQEQQPWCAGQPALVQAAGINSSHSSRKQPSAPSDIMQTDRQHCTSSSSSNGSNGSNGGSRSGRSTQQLGPHEPQQQLSGASVMRQLKSSTSWQQLQQLIHKTAPQLNWRHSCAAITHLAQLLAPHYQQYPQPHLQHLGQHQSPRQQQVPGLQQQQLEQDDPEQQTQLPVQPPQQLQQRHNIPSSLQDQPPWVRSSQEQQQHSESQLQQFVESSMMPLIDDHLQDYDARGLANCLWSLAKLRAVVQPSAAWLQSFYSTSQPLLHLFDAQQLSNTLWGLVQLQQVPPVGWMQQWYVAMLQACAGTDPGWQPQSASSALWSLAQLYGNSSSSRAGSSRAGNSSSSNKGSRSEPSSQWVGQLLQATMQRVAAAGKLHGQSSSSGGSDQIVSNLLWACVQLQQQPSLQVLQMVHAWLRGAAAADGASGGRQQQVLISDQALANCLWALGKLRQQQQQQRQQRQQHEGSRTHKVMAACGRLLLQISSSRLASTSNQHLSNMLWGAGALQLRLDSGSVAAVIQQLVLRADSLSDQQVANLLWGLSHIKQQQQQQSSFQQQLGASEQPAQAQQGVAGELQQQLYPGLQQQQQPLVLQPSAQQLQPQPNQQRRRQSDAIEQLLAAHVDRLQGFSSQAISSTLLSCVRLQHHPTDATLQPWLQALARRNINNSSDATAVTDACCALALLRQRQQQTWAAQQRGSLEQRWASSSSSSRGMMLGSPSMADSQWLQDMCAGSVGRLGVFTADQLCAVGWALTLLRFRAPVGWLAAWQAALVNKASSSSMDPPIAARALRLLQDVPGIAALGAAALQTARLQLADAAVTSATAAAAAGKATAQDVSAAAACISYTRSGGSRGRRGAHSMQQLLQVVPAVLRRSSVSQLTSVLGAAAAIEAPLTPGLLPDILQQTQQRQQQCSACSWAHLLVAVAKVSKQQQQRQHWQQQQQQQHRLPSQQPQEQEQPQPSAVFLQDHDQQVVLSWLQHTLPLLPLGRSSAADLSMCLWALAVLTFHPGRSWLDAWVQHSTPLLPRMTPQQLASVGWALTVLRHRPESSWLAAWSRCVAQAAAAAAVEAPRSLALLLYCSATLGCPINTAWLKSVGALAARHAEAWSAADVADGLWGLAQLGFRAMADEELLEVLLGRLVEVTGAPGELQQLGPHRQLQVLQAAVLLGPGPDAMQQHQQHQQHRQQQEGQGQQQEQQQEQQQQRMQRSIGRRRQKLRWLKFRAHISSLAARQAAAALQQQVNGGPGSSSDGSISSSSSHSRALLAAAVGKAAVVSAKYVQTRTGRHPAAVGYRGPLKPSWLFYWCRCSAQTLALWQPQQLAAALAAFAALQWQPPLAWQQQVLAHVVRHGPLSLPTANAIQDALVALQSPLVKSWRTSSTLRYGPAAAAAATPDSTTAAAANPAAAAAAASQPGGQQQQQGSSVAAAGLVTQRPQQQLRVLSGVEPRYPHHLRGHAMQRMHSKQRLMRLVGWWRQQQVMQQQYAQQRQQQQELEDHWRAAAAAAAQMAHYSTWGSSSSGSAVSSPRSSVDVGGGMSSASSSSSSSSGRVGSQPAVTRKLDNSTWGRQLLRPPARPPAASDAAVTNAVEDSSSSSSSSSSDASETVAAGPSPAAAVAVEVPGSNGTGDAAVTSEPIAPVRDAAAAAAALPQPVQPVQPQPLPLAPGTVLGTINSSSGSSSLLPGADGPAAGGGGRGSGGADADAGGSVVQVMRGGAAGGLSAGFDSWAAVGGAVGQLAVGSGAAASVSGRQVGQFGGVAGVGSTWQQQQQP